MEQVTVRIAEVREPLAPLLVGRLLHLLGSRRAQPLGGGVDVVRVDAELEVASLVLGLSLGHADPERLELQKGEFRLAVGRKAVDLLEAEVVDVELRGALDVVDAQDREWLAEARHRCASSHETTGFRSTPIFSISASITSPGFR